MTHDKNLFINKLSYSPVSLENAESSARLEMTLEKVVMQAGKEHLSALLDESRSDIIQNEKVVSSTSRSTTPGLWAFGLLHSTPCV
jgi:hypothetical protein